MKVTGVVPKIDANIKNVPIENKIVANDINEIVLVVNQNDDLKTDKGGYVGSTKDLKDELDTAVFGGGKTYQTKAEQDADLPIPDNNTPSKIANDPNPLLNGNWSVSSGAWIQNDSIVSQIIDSEDIKTYGNSLLISDRAKSPSNESGYYRIRNGFDWASIPAGYADCTLEIIHSFDLGGGNISIPSNVTLKFSGGGFLNGTLTGDNTKIESGLVKILGTDIILGGTWSVTESYPQWFGAVGDGVADDTLAVKKCFSLSDTIDLLNFTYKVTSQIIITLTQDTVFKSNGGSLVYSGAVLSENLVYFNCNGYSITVEGVVFRGGELASGGIKIENSSSQNGIIPNCTLLDNKFLDFKMLVANSWNQGAFVRGLFEVTTIEGNLVQNITRLAGTGVSGAQGTSGIAVTPIGNNTYTKSCVHKKNTYDNISGGDAFDSLDNVDYDGFIFFTNDPTNYPNTDSSVNRYAESTLKSYENTYKNCRGRSMKIKGISSIYNETIIRDSGYTKYGGSSEIDLQWGVGMVNNINFFYNDYSVEGVTTSPLNNIVTLIGAYRGAYYGEENTSLMISNLNVINGIKTGVGSYVKILNITGSGSTVTQDRPLVSLSNIAVNRGIVESIITLNFSTGRSMIMMDNIVVDKLLYAAITSSDSNANVEITANNIRHLYAITNPVNNILFYSDTSGLARSFGGKLNGSNNRGFIEDLRNGSSNNYTPMLTGALSDKNNNRGGSVSVQSVNLPDDGVHTFENRGFGNNCIIVVSSDFSYVASGVLLIGASDIITIAADAGNILEPSVTGVNYDTDGKLNLWMDASQQLNIKNRIGSSRTFTITFMG